MARGPHVGVGRGGRGLREGGSGFMRLSAYCCLGFRVVRAYKGAFRVWVLRVQESRSFAASLVFAVCPHPHVRVAALCGCVVKMDGLQLVLPACIQVGVCPSSEGVQHG